MTILTKPRWGPTNPAMVGECGSDPEVPAVFHGIPVVIRHAKAFFLDGADHGRGRSRQPLDLAKYVDRDNRRKFAGSRIADRSS